jgi:uncharacterized membrane protein YdjX (TVP38/TMEM64 family)
VISRRLLRPLALVAIVVAAVTFLRRGLGIGDAESLQAAVSDLGIWGPLAYVGIVTFRIPLMLPSALVLMAGALLFSAVTATLCGAVGLTLSALGFFLGGRFAGRAAVESRIPPRLRPLIDLAGTRLGALFVGVGTAYPFGPITAYHVLAGVTGMGVLAFAVAAAGGSLGRSALYTFFGRRLIEGDARSLLEAGVVMTALLALPLLFPRTRRWVLYTLRSSRGAAAPPPAPPPPSA